MAKRGGFPGGGMPGNMANLMKQAQKMQRQMEEQQKELEKFRNSLKRGDKVVTIGGIYGVVDEIKERQVIIKVDGDTKLKVDKNSLVKDFTETQQ